MGTHTYLEGEYRKIKKGEKGLRERESERERERKKKRERERMREIKR